MLTAKIQQIYITTNTRIIVLPIRQRQSVQLLTTINGFHGRKRRFESWLCFNDDRTWCRFCSSQKEVVIGNSTQRRRYMSTSIENTTTNLVSSPLRHVMIFQGRTNLNSKENFRFFTASRTIFGDIASTTNHAPKTTIISSSTTTNNIDHHANTYVDIDDDDDDDDMIRRNQRKILLDAVNHVVKKQKHFWTIDELNIQTQRLLDYCNSATATTDNDVGHNNYITSLVKHNAKMAVTKSSTTSSSNYRTKSSTTTTTNPSSSGVSGSVNYKYGRPSANIFYQVLEAWMERSMIMAEQPGITAATKMESAERARLLLNAMLPKRDMYQPHTTGIGSRNPAPFVQNSKLAFFQNLLQTSFYEVVLQAYAVSNAGLPAAIRAEALLLQMIQRCKFHMKHVVRGRKRIKGGMISQQQLRMDRLPVPTLKTFNIVLNCWAKSYAHEAPDRVNALLILMEQWHEQFSLYAETNHIKYDYNNGCLPNERSILCLIEAWTNGRPNEAPDVTLRILRENMIVTDQRNITMNPISSSTLEDANNKHSSIKAIQMVGRRYRNVHLDEAVFNAVIYAWVRSNRGRSAAMQVEDILQMMIQWSQNTRVVGDNGTWNRITTLVQPTTRTYSMIIMAWAECETIESKGDAAQRAETILMKMVQLYSEGQDSVKPNSLLFTSCIAAWSRAAISCYEAPDRAERLWELLRKMYVDAGQQDIELEPTTQIGNAVISAWSRCVGRPDSVERALDALNVLKQEGKDNLISYNSVLDAMSKKGCAQDALKLLQWLESSESQRYLVPDLVSYNSVLAAFGRSSTTSLTQEDKDSGSKGCNAEEAEALLRRMEKTNGVKPDKLSYTSVINAWSRSDNPQKVFRASALLRDMIRRYENGDITLKPDVYVYTTLINTCAYSRFVTSEENNQALQMALNAMATLENTGCGPPNDVTYATIMTAIYRLSSGKSNDHDSHYEVAFRSCAARGLLTNDVMQVFQRGASTRLFRRLTNNTGRLQPEWSRNVPDDKKPGNYK